MRQALPFVLGCALLGCAAPAPSPSEDVGSRGGKADARELDLAALLATLPGVVELSEDADEFPLANLPPGQERQRTFRIRFQQPIDHDDPSRGTFSQRVVLSHRGRTAPLVYSTLGYELTEGEEELTGMLSANQLTVEHRYFQASRPDAPVDWRFLTIEQAAADHHAIARAFHRIYAGPWISTGASKGGMTALIHRSRYPDDVDATVAYVAPYSRQIEDPRYLSFFDQVGEATCRRKLTELQHELLARRRRLIPIMVARPGDEFTRLGADAAFENTVVELRWSFWQYEGASSCAGLPGADADDRTLFDEALVARGLPAYGAEDRSVARYEAYIYQAHRELGYPQVPTDGLLDVIEGRPSGTAGLPLGETPAYDGAAMQRTQAWLAEAGERVILVYGGADPWTAGAFDLGHAEDSARFDVPDANHGAILSDLPPAQRERALAMLQRWTGAATPPSPIVASDAWRAAELARRAGNPSLRERLLARALAK